MGWNCPTTTNQEADGARWNPTIWEESIRRIPTFIPLLTSNRGINMGMRRLMQTPGLLLLENSNPKISSTATAAVTSNQSLPFELTRTPKSKSFVFPPSLPNSNFPSAVDSYLPIGHPVHNIPPPRTGRIHRRSSSKFPGPCDGQGSAQFGEAASSS